MLAIRGVYEVAVRVHDLARAERFYRETLGLPVGLRDERRPWLFLRAGAGLIVLQQERGEWPVQHFAFTVDESHLEDAAKRLRDAGVEVSGPVLHEWIPARSLYFRDPDGHDLELCAPVERTAPAEAPQTTVIRSRSPAEVARRHAAIRPRWLKWVLLLIPASFLLWILIRIRVIAP